MLWKLDRDPDVTPLATGRIRLVYLSGFGSPSSGLVRAMCVAESEDGMSYTVIGRALSLDQDELATDPSVTALPEGTWLMALSLGQRTIMATSADGLAFERFDTRSFGGVPEVAALPDGRVRLYVCAQGIESHLSDDRGRSWRRETTVAAPGTGGKRIMCDPSFLAGVGLFLYKTAY